MTSARAQAAETCPGSVFLAATDGNNSVELWRSDGTQAGTVMVLDALPGMAGIAPTHMAAVPAANVIVFSAQDPAHGREPWVSDGTPSGTKLLVDLRPGRESSQAGAQADFVVTDDRVYFTAVTAPRAWSCGPSPRPTWSRR